MQRLLQKNRLKSCRAQSRKVDQNLVQICLSSRLCVLNEQREWARVAYGFAPQRYEVTVT